MLKLFDFISTLNFHQIAIISEGFLELIRSFFLSFDYIDYAPPIIQSKIHKTTWTWCRSKCKTAMLPVKPK